MIKKILINYSVFAGLTIAIVVFSIGGLEESLVKKISWLYPSNKFDSMMTLTLTVDSKHNMCNLEHCSPIKIYFVKVENFKDKLMLYSKIDYQMNSVIEFQDVVVDSTSAKIAITKDLHKEISATTPTKLIEAMRITVLKNYWFNIILYFTFMFFVTFIGVYLSDRSKKKALK